MRKVEVNARINTSPNRIIEAFVHPTMLSSWWNVQRSLIEHKEGGLYMLAWNISENGFGYVSTGTIAKYLPDRLLSISNYTYLNPVRSLLGPMRLTIEATKMDDGSSLYLCQDGYQRGGDWDWYYDSVKQAWPIVTQSLARYLEGLEK